MKLIDKQLLDDVSRQAQKSDRLRMNYNFHHSLDDKCHRFLNAVEPGTKVEIHRHPTEDESFVVLRGKVKVSTYNDDGSVIDSVVLSQEDAELNSKAEQMKAIAKRINKAIVDKDIEIKEGK